jgi:eukaryotic-like serine/threonine-protein kinase
MSDREAKTPLIARGRRVPPPGLQVGDHVGDWTVAEQLDVGGFGTVYRVTAADGRTAALKVLHAEVASSPEIVARFRRETDAVRRIAHDCVVEVYDVGELADGRPYFVMEHLVGEDLRTRLKREGALPLPDVVEIVSAVASALEAAHAHGIIHRDIKPSNVFLANRAGVRRVVLLDFGVAKLLDDGGEGLTRSREAIGSPSSMAPEQIRGGPVDARTDVYGLGALAFAAITGAMPFADRSVLIVQNMHLYAKPPRPSSIAPVARAFDAVIARSLDKNPIRRYPSAPAFADAMRAALTGAQRSEGDSGARIAVIVDAGVDRAHLVDPDDALLDDLDAVLAATIDRLVPLGFEVVEETADTVTLQLAVGALSDDEITAAIDALRTHLAVRADADSRVQPRVARSSR